MTHRIAASLLDEPALDLTAHPKADFRDLVRHLDAVTSPTGGLRVRVRGRISDLPGFDEGLWWVQDAAAALPAQILGASAGETVLDLCAAPGGKTAQLAAAGAHVVAVDQSAARLERVRDNLNRLDLKADLVVADAGVVALNAPFDRVLLDAPCTATGTLRRHPDGKCIKSPEDVAAMAKIQARLLAAAVDYVKPGGTLVYCVCSLEAAEGPDRIARLLASGAAVERVVIKPAEIHGLAETLLPQGDVQTLPCHAGGMDGFFISRLRRL